MSAGFQGLASAQGRSYEDAVAAMLQVAGWTIMDRRYKVADVEVDIVAVDPDGTLWWIECKGSARGERPGARRADTVKKAIGVAWLISQLPDRPRYMLITSHQPDDDTSTARNLAAARRAGLFDRIETLWFSLSDLPDSDEEETP